MPSFSHRTKYTPLWETWCDTCTKGVSPDHAGNCAWCGTTTRRNHHANRDHPGRFPGIPAGLFDAARKAQSGGVPIAEFARAALHLTNYGSVASLSHTIRSEFHRRGWMIHDSATASRVTKTRYKQRLALGERTPDLCVSTNRRGEPCKRHATPGYTHCNLHDPARRDEMQAKYTDRLRTTAKRLAASRTMWSELAPELRAWVDAYGHGARTAALNRSSVTLNVFQGLLRYERRGIDRPMTAASEAAIRGLLATPPRPLPGDGMKRRKVAS